MSSKTKPEKSKDVKQLIEDTHNGHSQLNATNNGTNDNLLGAHPRFSRLIEKNALVGLNNRLASIIDRNRQLESENLHLTAEVKHTEEKLHSVSRSLKTTFDNENKEIRKQLDNLEKEKAKLVLSESNVRSKLKEAEDKIKKRDTENSKLHKDLEDVTTKKEKVEAELRKEKENSAKLLKAKAEVEDDNRKLRQENEDFKKFNEDHLLTQVDLKNALKDKQEELAVKAQVHQTELQAISSKSAKVVQKLGEKAKQEFEKKLEDAIKSLRADCEQQFDQNKKDQEHLHQIKEKDLKGQIAKFTTAIAGKEGEVKEISIKVETALKKISELEGEKHALEKKVKGAEERAVKTEGKYGKEIKAMEKDLKDLQDDKEKLIGEYQDLMEIKVALDNEIATYRNLLEGEEDRLQIFVDQATKPQQAEKPEETQILAEQAQKEVIVQL